MNGYQIDLGNGCLHSFGPCEEGQEFNFLPLAEVATFLAQHEAECDWAIYGGPMDNRQV